MTGKRYKLHHDYNFGYGVEDTYNHDRLYLDEFELLVDEMNNLNDENEQLKESAYSWSKSYNRVYKENEQLKEQLSEQGIQIDFLKDENQHMGELINENKRLKQDKDDLIDYIKKEFPKSYKQILEGFE